MENPLATGGRLGFVNSMQQNISSIGNQLKTLGVIDPPIIGQKYCNISFMLFDSPQPTSQGQIHGFVKVRGNHETEEIAVNDGHRIIKDVEKDHKILTGPTGYWIPITESPKFVKNEYDVKIKDEEVHLRDKAVHQKNKEREVKLKELREAEENFKNSKDIYDDPDSLDFYVLKRNTEMKLREMLDMHTKKVKEIESKLGTQMIILKEMELDHPEYKDKWIDRLNEERKKSGWGDFVPAENQFEIYDKLSLESLKETYPYPKPEERGKSSNPNNEIIKDNKGELTEQDLISPKSKFFK